jgi:hypothetical protein
MQELDPTRASGQTQIAPRRPNAGERSAREQRPSSVEPAKLGKAAKKLSSGHGEPESDAHLTVPLESPFQVKMTFPVTKNPQPVYTGSSFFK